MSKQRILSMALAALMSLSVLPVSALAASVPQGLTQKTLPVTLYDYGSTVNGNFETAVPRDLNEGLDSQKQLVFGGSGLYGLNSCYNAANGGYLDQCIYRGIADDTVPTAQKNIIPTALSDKNLFDTSPTNYKKVFTDVAFPFSFNNETGEYFFNSSDTDLLYDKATKSLAATGKTSKGFWPFGTGKPYFGLSMDLDFNMPPDGRIGGQPMIYQFSGDDDLWVYIDEHLTLDIGGIHYATHGAIDFAAEKVWYGENTVFADQKEARPALTRAAQPVTIHGVRYSYYTTFADLGLGEMAPYTAHKMRIYYMERGAGESNNMMRFNLPTFTGNPNLTKVLGAMNPLFLDGDRTYQFLVKSGKSADDLCPYTGTYTLTRDGKTTEGLRAEKGNVTIKANDIVAFDMKTGDYVQMAERADENYDKTRYAVSWVGGETPPQTESDPNDGTGLIAPVRKIEARRLLYTFTNAPSTGELEVCKALTAGSSAPQQEFGFKIWLTNQKYNISNLLYTGLVTVNGAERALGEDGILLLKAGESATVKGLPVGTEYRVQEQPAEGYQLSTIAPAASATAKQDTAEVAGTIAEEAKYSSTFTNVPEFSVKVKKVWQGPADDTAKIEQINCTLERKLLDGSRETWDKSFALSLTLTRAEQWEKIVSNLPQRAPDGKEYRYTVRTEAAVTGYELAGVQELTEGGLPTVQLTNRRAEQGAQTVVKHWLDGGDTASRPNGLTLTLHRGVQTDAGIQEDTAFLSRQPAQPTPVKDAGTWTYEYPALELYNENGAAYHYWVSEEPVAGYEAIRPAGVPAENLELYNRKLVDVTIEKQWEDNDDEARLRPTELKLQLMRGKEGTQPVPVGEAVTVSAATGWKVTLAKLPGFDENGVNYVYSVAEPSQPDFYTVKPQSVPSTVITNVLKPRHSVTVRFVEQGTERKLLPDEAVGSFYEDAAYDAAQSAAREISGYTRIGPNPNTAPVSGTMGREDLLILVEYARVGSIPIETRYREVTPDADGNFDRAGAVPIDGIVDVKNYYLPGEAYDVGRDPALTAGYRYLTSEDETGAAVTEFTGAAKAPLTVTHYFAKEENSPVSKVLHTYYHLHRPLQGAVQLSAEGQQASVLPSGGDVRIQDLLLARYNSLAYLPQTAEVIRTKLPQTQTELDALVAAEIAARTAKAAAAEKAVYDEKLAAANAATEQVKAAQQAYEEAQKALEDAVAAAQQHAVDGSEAVKNAEAALNAAQQLTVGLTLAEKAAQVSAATQTLEEAKAALETLPPEDAGRAAAEKAVAEAEAAFAAAQALPAGESYVSEAYKAAQVATAQAVYTAALDAAKAGATASATPEQALKEAKEALDAATIAEVEANRQLAQAKAAYQQRMAAEQALYAEGTDGYAAVLAAHKETAAPQPETIYTGPAAGSFEVLPKYSYLVKLVYQRETAETPLPTPTPTPVPVTPEPAPQTTGTTAATLPKTSASRAKAAGSAGMLMLLAGAALQLLKRRDI